MNSLHLMFYMFLGFCASECFMYMFHRDLRSFVIRFDFESYVRFEIRFNSDGTIRNFRIVRAVNRHS